MTTTQRSRPVVRSQVEPRIVERRRSVAEAQHRRRRNRWIALGVVIVLVAAAVGLLLSPAADVDRVVVEGASAVAPDELRAASGVRTGDHLVSTDLAAARDRLRAHPMVAAASVRREWPDTVRISVIEEVPLLQVRTGDVVRIVSRSGRVLPESAAGADALALLDTGDADVLAGVEVGGRVPEPVAATLVVQQRMGPALRERLAVVSLGGGGLLSFDLADGATVRFGSVEDVAAKLVAVESVLTQVALECLDVLDVQRPDRPTVTRLAGCAAPPTTETTPPTTVPTAEPVPGSDASVADADVPR